MTDFIKRRLRLTVSKELLIDLEDRLRAEAVKAFEMIRDRAGLNRKRARELEGQARFRMMEEGFEDVCQLHGGRLLDGGVIPNTELKVFQPFMRFEVEGKGIILGLAAMPEPKAVPHKNMSRQAGVTMNYHLSPRLDLDGSGPRIGDIFALFLVARDREKAGQIQEMAIGVVDSKYEGFLYYEQIDQFLSGSGDAPETRTTPTAVPPASSVSLKANVKPFVPPEARKPKKEDGGAGQE
ncbi:hypothetical protein CCR94_07250 [Rhodoblastus sphagnicola]|uniref:Uncharacterized protein n=1 Tax=Rhodoblastus sphagnicola TaxID=333368 RepID=A0A2S6NBL8_9HYPH|nr:hypothetical protein [Rhodoblastus sphagnicola]MBB4199651.1 hypothetical protein [Rhodoblastus sphagnicola]PPQ31997.1 hypothetical protein CCR94_07250 [Rhodoblastus sphagnicola]